MTHESDKIDLTLDELRALGGWAAECAERVLPLFESRVRGDDRPRAAITAIREFAAGDPRTASLRSVAMAALAAARESGDPVADAAARAAGLSASIAYLHPLARATQTKHITGPPAYAALARERACPDAVDAASAEVRWAIEHAPPAVTHVLRRFPAYEAGRGRLDTLMQTLDGGLRKTRDEAWVTSDPPFAP